MIFYETSVGSPGAVFPPTQRVHIPFAFPTSVRTAHAVLQSFHLRTRADDSQVEDVAVVLTTHFDPYQSTTGGEVEVELRRTGSAGGILLATGTIEAQVRILVIGM